uniref:Fibronectin type-III domain-containing protein n=1 Tax=Callorhinchus milii TaxID=7868 RepID=A0A4W3JIS9_CALMI
IQNYPVLRRWVSIFLFSANTVFGQVPKPQNVKIHSVNFKHVLQWDPVVCRKGNISYSVGYQSSYSHFYEKDEPFEKSCTNINTTQCDLSNALADEISYWLHVRAKCKSRTSKWAAVEDFQPFRDTLIGPPPNFNVKVKLDMLDVLFAEPMKENSQRTMRSYYTSMAFKISYWKNTDPKKVCVACLENTKGACFIQFQGQLPHLFAHLSRYLSRLVF